MKQTLTLEKASLVLYQPGQERQEAKRTPALECAQGDQALQLLRTLGSAPPATWLSPQDVSLQWQMDPDLKDLCSLFGFASWDAPLTHHLTPGLGPAAWHCASFSR